MSDIYNQKGKVSSDVHQYINKDESNKMPWFCGHHSLWLSTKILNNFVPLYKIHTLFPQETDKNRIVKRWAEEKV